MSESDALALAEIGTSIPDASIPPPKKKRKSGEGRATSSSKTAKQKASKATGLADGDSDGDGDDTDELDGTASGGWKDTAGTAGGVYKTVR